MIGITPRQHDLLAFVRKTIEARGYPPTYREIAAGIGNKSISRIGGMVEQLIERGQLYRHYGCLALPHQAPQPRLVNIEGQRFLFIPKQRAA